ncbi:hypothetical protein KY285_022683 [Solanum tuberosum]|nr:hypothetical protein KY285_022683 [Solanum tuberosum]
MEIGAKYSFPKALITSKVATLDPEFVKRFIDTVVMNLTTDPQSQHTFFNHVLVVAETIQPCIRNIYIDVLQALKSGCHPNIQAEHVAHYKAAFLETLVHHMEVLCPITHNHKDTVAFKDRITMLNFLRDNLINLPREALEDFDTAIINVGILVYSTFDSPELNQVPVLDIQNHLKEFLSRYLESLSSIRSQLRTIHQQLEHFQKQHDGFGSFAMQVIAKAYEVEHIVDSCINKDIPE